MKRFCPIVLEANDSAAAARRPIIRVTISVHCSLVRVCLSAHCSVWQLLHWENSSFCSSVPGSPAITSEAVASSIEGSRA